MSTISSQQFRVCILGAGGISPEHASTLQWLPSTKIIGVCDLDYSRAKALSDKFNIPGVYTSIDDMLANCKPDAVHLLLQPDLHVQFAIKCLEAGTNVFVEKPIGINTAECRELLNVAKTSQLTVGVNHNMLYLPSVQKLIDQIRNFRLGRIVHINIGWSMPPSKLKNLNPNSFFLQEPQNPLFEWAVHPLSIVNRLLGKVERVQTIVNEEHKINSGKNFFTTWQSSFECNRGTAQLVISVGHGFDNFWMDVLGEDAFAHLDLFNDSLIFSEYTHFRPAIANIRNSLFKSSSLLQSSIGNMKNYIFSGLGLSVPPASPLQACWRNSIHSFYDALSNKVPPQEGIEQGMAVVEYCERIFESSGITA